MSVSPALSPRSRFADLVARSDADIDLAEAALLVAAEQYPQLAVSAYLHRLDVLAERVRDRLANEVAPLIVLQELNQVLFQQERFRGNVAAYYDPRNSFLNDVLDRHLGIPITLSIVYLEVGRRLGLPLAGVNFPGHFLVSYTGEALDVTIDAFDMGRLRFPDEMQGLLDRLYGGMVRLRPEFLRPAGRKDVLVRLLTNLKHIYLNIRDEAHALAAIERLLLVRPSAAEEVRDRGMLLARTGRVHEALRDLERYLDVVPGAPDAERVRLLIETLHHE